MRPSLSCLDLELRIWKGLGRSQLEGYLIRRRTGIWEAVRVCQVGDHVSRASEESQDWWRTWDRVMDADLIPAIRDDSEIDDDTAVRDGASYVVEVAEGEAYRTVMVDNPRILPSASANRMLAVMFLVNHAFRDLRCPMPAGPIVRVDPEYPAAYVEIPCDLGGSLRVPLDQEQKDAEASVRECTANAAALKAIREWKHVPSRRPETERLSPPGDHLVPGERNRGHSDAAPTTSDDLSLP